VVNIATRLSCTALPLTRQFCASTPYVNEPFEDRSPGKNYDDVFTS